MSKKCFNLDLTLNNPYLLLGSIIPRHIRQISLIISSVSKIMIVHFYFQIGFKVLLKKFLFE